MARKRKNENREQPFRHPKSRAERVAEKKARKKFVKACNRITAAKEPFTIEGLWTWGFVTDVTGEDQYIAPLVINAGKFPVGVAVWRDERIVDAKVRAEHLISEKLPLPEGQRVVKYRIGDELDPEVFVKSALMMYRRAFQAHEMGQIAGAAEDEFATAAVFFDPPLMKVDDELLVRMVREDNVRMLQYLSDVDFQAVLAWQP
ncbi:MAG: hypothetical protein GF311_27640 [Candidatus Lokiarchaeota archaeon]|nr:hypothetical protein [Candidatus Lokiarchaeota archaeon]